MDEMIDKAWWRFRVEDVWNNIRLEKEIQKVMVWRIDNQRQEERMMVNFTSRQERLQLRDEGKRKWREKRLKQLAKEDPMELGSNEDDWMVQEEQEHAAMDGMMAALELYDDMVLEDDPDGDNATMMDWNDDMEHEYLDRLLAESEENSNNKTDMDTTSQLPAKEPDGKSSTDDEQSGWQGGMQVAWQGQGMEDKNIDNNNINERAYRSGGTWWLSGWILPHPKQVMLGATKTKKKSCGCAEGDIGVGNRILTPTFRNCRSDLKRNKRFRNEATKWHNTFSEGGSLPKKYIVTGRRKTGH